MEKGICVVCGREFEKYLKRQKICSKDCRKKYNRMRARAKYRVHKIFSKKVLGKCPFLEKCRAWSGIDCSERDHRFCDFYRNILSEEKLNVTLDKKREENERA